MSIAFNQKSVNDAIAYDDDVEALIAQQVAVTIFDSIGAREKEERRLSDCQLAAMIRETMRYGADDKEAKGKLPHLKLARFGDKVTDKGSLRSNANVIAITGIEIDYDEGLISIEDAQRLFEEVAAVSAIIVATPSWRPDKPKWRAFCFTSEERPPSARVELVERLNGVFRGRLDQGASFTLSQPMFFGGVNDHTPQIVFAKGRPIDLAHDLDMSALPKQAVGSPAGTTTRAGKFNEKACLESIRNGEDYHGAMISLGGHWASKGVGYVEAVATLEAEFDAMLASKRDSRWKDRRASIAATLIYSYGREAAKDAKTAAVLKDDDADSKLDSEPESDVAPKPLSIAGFPLDQDGVIRAFTRRYKLTLKHDHSAGKWFRFDGNRWALENTKLALDFARGTSIELAKTDPKNAAVKALKNVPTWEAIERGARTVRAFAVTADVWDCDLMLMGTPGGTVDLRTGELRPGDPADYISKITAVAPIPLADFVPERDCRRWLAFLNQAFDGDAGAIRLLQQWGGYSLTGDTKEQKLVFAYGPGGSGKGTAINTIGDIMGEYAVNVPMETLTVSKYDAHPTELARLRGARMARASETEKGRAWAENRIKVLTGQDTITARFMGKDFFEFKPQFKLTIFGNNAPSLKDVDAAMRRRFIIMPFDHPPVERDLDLGEKLKAEWPGILSWLMAGCLDWQANQLVRPSVVNAATEAYFSEQDVFGQWVEECLEQGPTFVATADDLWESWQPYASKLGEDPGSKKRTFPEHLSQRGFEAIKDTAGIRGRGYRGVRLAKQEAGDEDDFI